ncbi:MAG TPA: N-acetyl-gamma-glutamyl-phosphate reductase [Gammaproteobacteria bacterium]|nr:N-acetyl-gamma-glutamyl-phosphate reductase [Gammaproteobacteria bacterium]
MLKAGVIGGTGYTGVELLRILAAHPEVSVELITSRGQAGEHVADYFPSLRGHYDIEFQSPEKGIFDSCDVVFATTPNGVAMNYAPELLSKGIKFIDLSADFRIKDIELWEKWYGMKHSCPDLVADAVYGLPEMNREFVRSANLIANPGCYPTATTLGLLPLLNAGVIAHDPIIVDAKSGVTGAGRTATTGTLYSEVSDSFKAYGVAGHRHQPEIRQSLSQITGTNDVGLTFVPHLTPMLRGIHSTIYVQLTDGDADLQSIFESHYASEPFVDVMPTGSHPDTRSVRASNLCRIAVHKLVEGNTAVILAVEDNLVKGAAGQAVQNMNLMFGLPETLGLTSVPVLP